MACAISDGYKQVNCPLPTPGAYQTLYIANFSDIATWGSGNTAGEKDGVTLKAGKGLYKYQVQRDTVIVRSEKQAEENGAINYTHEVTFRIMDMGLEARDRITEMNGVDLVVFARTKAGTIEIIGYENGARLAENIRSTEGADLGQMVVIRALNQPGLPLHFFDGISTATTLASLEGLVIGS
jgi:hypothetical protein